MESGAAASPLVYRSEVNLTNLLSGVAYQGLDVLSVVLVTLLSASSWYGEERIDQRG